jgi:NAD-dependent deacetylase
MDELIRFAAIGLVRAHYAIALTGAGISTESGIPDFRGPSGLWTLNPNAERKAFMGYDEFVSDPKAWWRRILTEDGNAGFDVMTNLDHAQPNAGHYALAALEKMGLLKATITEIILS